MKRNRAARPHGRRGWQIAGAWILRECFPRKRRFEAFEASLGITRHVLADRLKKLMRFACCAGWRIRNQKSLDLYPIIISIVDWGNLHMVDTRGRPMLHQHKNCGHMFDPVMVCSVRGE